MAISSYVYTGKHSLAYSRHLLQSIPTDMIETTGQPFLFFKCLCHIPDGGTLSCEPCSPSDCTDCLHFKKKFEKPNGTAITHKGTTKVSCAFEWWHPSFKHFQAWMPYSSSSPLQPPLLKPFWKISSIFLTHLLQRNKLLPTSVATMRTLGRNRKSRKDGANTRWEQPCCVCWEKKGVCKHTWQIHTLIWRGIAVIFALVSSEC